MASATATEYLLNPQGCPSYTNTNFLCSLGVGVASYFIEPLVERLMKWQSDRELVTLSSRGQLDSIVANACEQTLNEAGLRHAVAKIVQVKQKDHELSGETVLQSVLRLLKAVALPTGDDLSSKAFLREMRVLVDAIDELQRLSIIQPLQARTALGQMQARTLQADLPPSVRTSADLLFNRPANPSPPAESRITAETGTGHAIEAPRPNAMDGRSESKGKMGSPAHRLMTEADRVKFD